LFKVQALRLSRELGLCGIPIRLLIALLHVLTGKHTSMRMKVQMPVIMFALIMLVALTSHSAAQDPKSQIKAEIERLTNSLREKPITDPDYVPLSSTAGQTPAISI
jgi:hypothetical protein